MRMKRIMSLLMAAVVTVSLSACGADQPGNVSSGSSSATADGASGETVSDADKVRLTALVVTSSLTEDVNTHQYLTDIAEQAGVEIIWEQVVDSSWADRKSTMLAGGEIPYLIV